MLPLTQLDYMINQLLLLGSAHYYFIFFPGQKMVKTFGFLCVNQPACL